MRKSQPNGELPLIHHFGGPVRVEDATVAGFGDDESTAVQVAIVWAFEHRRVSTMSARSAAEHSGIRSQHFSRILKGSKYLPLQDLNAFECVVGNTAVTQTLTRFADRRRRELDELVAREVVARLGRAAA